MCEQCTENGNVFDALIGQHKLDSVDSLTLVVLIQWHYEDVDVDVMAVGGQ